MGAGAASASGRKQSDLIGGSSLSPGDSLMQLDLGGSAGAAAPPPSASSGLDDLLGLSLGGPSMSSAPSGGSNGLGGLFDMSPPPPGGGSNGGGDFLGMGGMGGPSSTSMGGGGGGFGDLMGLGGGMPPAPAAASQPPPLDQVNVTLQTVQPGDFPPATMYVPAMPPCHSNGTLWAVLVYEL